MRHEPWACVVVATDLTEGGDRAVRRTALLPLAADAHVVLLHALPERPPAGVRKEVEREVHEKLEEAAEPLRKRGWEVTLETAVGKAFVEIIRQSRGHEADLIVVGRHGKRPVRDLFLGSTASRVARNGDIPVLTVQGEPVHGYRRVLIGVDLEDASRKVVGTARQLMGSDTVKISVMHACRDPFERFITQPEIYEGYLRAVDEDARARMNRFRASLDAGARAWSFVTRHGDARVEILREITRQKAELAVLGTHARSGIVHALLGSVAESVLESAVCDVLIARPVRVTFELP